MGLEQVISGGQTGVDQIALLVAQALGFRTGGFVPRGWKTDDGPAPWLAQYGCVQSTSDQYLVRTVENIRAADATVWFGDVTSPGGRQTKKISLLEKERREYHWIENPSVEDLSVYFGSFFQIKILNVAGNRLRTNPQATEVARDVLTLALRP